MKKLKFWHILVTIISLLVLYVVGLICVNAIRTPNVVKKVNDSEIKMMPSIDFVQPYYVYGFDDDDYDNYFNSLSEIGYDTIIVQYTRSEDYIENSVTGEINHGNYFYYPTELTAEFCDNDISDQDVIVIEDVLGRLLDECAEHNFDCYIGLSVEEYSWWGLINYYDEAYMKRCSDIDCAMAKEISELYGDKEAFIGWYFAFELFSNPIGWEKIWAKNVKALVDTIDELDDRPLMLSPFRQIQLGLITDEYSMWCSFFKRAGLRVGDIFCPQDSIGKLDDTGDPTTGDGHETITNANLRRVYDYTNACKKACDKYNVKYYINCELFRAVNGESAYLFVSDIERVTWQIKNASNIADKLVTFSATHYLVDDRNNAGIDTYENRHEYLEDYKELYNSFKAGD